MSKCPTCGEEYQRLGQHFHWHEEHRPALSPRQRDVVRYLTLAGVSVRDDNNHPRLETYSVDEGYVSAIAGALGWLANEPRIYDTDDVDHHRDAWAVSTIGHPEIAEYREPKDVERLTPRVLRRLLLDRGEWVGTVFGSLHIDVRGAAVDGDHLRTLLGGVGVREFCDDTKTWQGDLMHRGHWDEDVVAIPHGWALETLDYAGLDLTDIPMAHDLFLTEKRANMAFTGAARNSD